MDFWQFIDKYPEYGILIFLTLLSIFSKRVWFICLGFISFLAIKNIAGKTTDFNVNIIATLGVTVSIVVNTYQFIENKKLRTIINRVEQKEENNEHLN